MSIASIGDALCESVTVFVPQHGPWYADVALLDDTALSGRVTLSLGTLSLEGTVTDVGTRGEQTFARITAGAGAWGTMLPPKGYQNDAGVKARLVAEDAAREAGETLETLTTTAQLGVHYVRRMSVASRVLESAIGSAWHVGYDGVTRVGPRDSHTPGDGAYIVIDVHPADGVVTLGLDDLGAVVIGSRLSDGLDAPLAVRDLEIRVSADEAVIVAWCGDDATAGDRLSAAVMQLAQRAAGDKIFGLWRYRVISMDGERVKLQAVNAAAGLPDMIPVDMYPGLAGAHAELTNGAEVLVQFVEGSPSMPVITQYAGRKGPGHAPSVMTIDATTQINVGASAADFVALAAKVKTELDAIRSSFNGHTHSYNPGPGALVASATPTTPMPAISSVAASKARAE